MKIKVLHSPYIIGGNASGLEKGERAEVNLYGNALRCSSLLFWPNHHVRFSGKTTKIAGYGASNKKAKVTKFVLEAVERLKRVGISFRFTLVEGVKNTEAVQV